MTLKPVLRSRLPLVFALFAAVAAAAAAAVAQGPQPPSPGPLAQTTLIAPEVRAALGIDSAVEQLQALQASGQGSSLAALNLRQTMLEHVMLASFQVDDVLGRIDTEASYTSEDRYVLQVHAQRQANALNLLTFGASGALGAAGSAMQLTHGLNHAGTALQAAAGGTSLVFTGIQLRSSGGKQPVRSPYNMLAEVLDQIPNPQSHYPALVQAYLRAPRPEGHASVADGITAAWRRLDRLKQGPKSNGAPVEDLIADRASNRKLSADELADREAMLHDLHANLILLRSDLQQLLLQTEGKP